MLVVAIVATVAAFLSLGQQVWLRQTQNLFDRSQADSMRHAALDWVGMLLMRDAKNNKTDHRSELWAKALPPLPYEGGAIAVKIDDAQGLFNLNNLVRNGQHSKDDVAVFKNLLRLLRLDPELANPLLDWSDADSNVLPGGAEDVEYLSGARPYRAANQPLTTIDELRLVKGFTTEIVAALRPHVTVLPTPTAINLNTASATVLAGLFNISLADAQRIEQAAAAVPLGFDKIDDVQKLLPGGTTLPPATLYTFSTSHFLVHADVSYGRLLRQSTALLQRPATGNSASILWHHPRYPSMPPDDKKEKT
jgi:general secretion pathway protein K